MNKQCKIIVLIFCSLKLLLHFIADSHSGFQGDELLHIETGKHLALGYMEFPPFIGLLAFAQNIFHSHSVFIYHIFPHLASVLILIFVANIVTELGGGNKAVFFVLLGILIAPGFERSQQLFQPVVFSQLFWIVTFYYLVRFVKLLDQKSLWLATAFCISGFLIKYDCIFLLFGLLSLFFFSRTRKALIQHKFWINILVFIICLLPNVLWQVSNHYPVLQMFSRLYETQLDKLNRMDNLKNLFVEINPVVSLFLFLTGVFYFFFSKNKSTVFPLAAAIGLSFSLLFLSNGKAYYFYPIALTVLPFGAVCLEQHVFSKRKWILYAVTVLMVLGCVLIPFGMPVYSFHRYLSRIYPHEKKEISGGEYAIKYDEYYTTGKWQKTLLELKLVYDSLPANEKRYCLIWAKNYAQAGAVNLLGNEYNLPAAFSYHGSFYIWAPDDGQMPNTIIAISYDVGNFFGPYFNEVKKVKTIYNPYANSEEELYQYIYICKQPKQNFSTMKLLFKSRIFE